MNRAHSSGKSGPDLTPVDYAIADHAERGRLLALAGTDPWALELRRAAHRIGRRHVVRAAIDAGRVTTEARPVVVVKKGAGK